MQAEGVIMLLGCCRGANIDCRSSFATGATKQLEGSDELDHEKAVIQLVACCWRWAKSGSLGWLAEHGRAMLCLPSPHCLTHVACSRSLLRSASGTHGGASRPTEFFLSQEFFSLPSCAGCGSELSFQCALAEVLRARSENGAVFSCALAVLGAWEVNLAP